jgi:radical SAM/Cys-rich protein
MLGNQTARLDDSTLSVPTFRSVLQSHNLLPFQACGIDVLQVNVGRLCNQTCDHCHVDAGPTRREIMSREIMESCCQVVEKSTIGTVDITGGAPELNPHFRWFVECLRKLRRHVIDRCNLTVLTLPGYRDLPAFLAQHEVEVVASLPCYLEANTDRQRGDGVFHKSIAALQALNAVGYGRSEGHAESRLTLTLVYNPLGPTLPPHQQQLEADYRRELENRYGIVFNRLYTITNMPINRFLVSLLQQGALEAYLEQLHRAFNPATVAGVMCRNTLSVDWQGFLYDCDFNQMLGIGMSNNNPVRIQDLDGDGLLRLATREIRTSRHCFGCTAGAGSSCQGSLVLG